MKAQECVPAALSQSGQNDCPRPKSIRQTVIVWGALILSTGCILTGFYAVSYTVTAVLMALLGLGGGLFVVPLVTLMQKHAPENVRGQILATAGFFDMLGVFLASGIFWTLGTQAGLSASSIILVGGGNKLGGIADRDLLQSKIAA